MLSSLNAEYVDCAAGQLAWSLDAPNMKALSVVPLGTGSVRLEMRILGTSHQMLLTEDKQLVLRETVACLPKTEPVLPSEERAHLEGWEYTFHSEVETLGAEAFKKKVHELLNRYERRQDAIVGIFPGDVLAVTALAGKIDEDVVAWETWHTYPETGEIVSTRTEVRR